jgi:hypothetical protein
VRWDGFVRGSHSIVARFGVHADANATSGNQAQLHTNHVLCLPVLLLVFVYPFHHHGSTTFAGASRGVAAAWHAFVQCCLRLLSECVSVHAHWEHECTDIECGRCVTCPLHVQSLLNTVAPIALHLPFQEVCGGQIHDTWAGTPQMTFERAKMRLFLN